MIMVQIGNIHIGKAHTAKEPSINIMEAAFVWDLLVGRYTCIEETSIYLKCVKDPELKGIIEKIGLDLLERQAKQLEQEMEIYKLPLPKRPPKVTIEPPDKTFFNDEFMFRKIFQGCQSFITHIAYGISISVTNDHLRKLFDTFLQEELTIFHNLCKYAKVKGWIETPSIL